MVWSLIELVLVLISVLMCSAFFTLFERKIMGLLQDREGPSKIFFWGFFQPFGDALKLLMKLSISLEISMDLVYFMSPFLSFFLSLICWLTYPVSWGMVPWYSSFLFILFCFGVSVYGLIFSGLFSRSKFASLGCVRGLSQSVSYEIPLSTCMLTVMVVFSCFNFVEFFEFQELVYLFFPFFLIFLCLLVVFLAEMNRSPFDLAEGESELVSGFSVELGGSMFVMVFLSEYVSLVWVCFFMSVIFFGGVDFFLGVKILFFMFFMVWSRSSVPRLRFDLVMMVCWYILIPLTVFFFLFYLCVLFNQSQSEEAYYC